MLVGGDDGPGKGKDLEDEIRETKDERSDAKMKNASATGQAKSIWSGHASRSQDEGDRKRFMAYVRSCRGQDDGANKVRDAFQGLANAWDHIHGLRHGHQVDRSCLSSRRSQASADPREHPNQHDYKHVLQLGFQLIGKSTVPRSGLDGTSHGLEICSVVARTLEELMQRKVQRWAADVEQYKALVVMRGHDASPFPLSFGQLAGKLAPYARYMVLEDGRYVSKRFEDVPHHLRGSLQYGAMEVFAQTCKICFTREAADNQGTLVKFREKRDVLVKPTILQRGNAGCAQVAFERGVPALRTEALNEIAKHHRWLLLQETPDNISYNVLKKKYQKEKLAKNVLYPTELNCSAHRLNRVATRALKEEESIGDIYTIKYVAQNSAQAGRLAKALRELCDDMHIIYDDTNHPNPDLTRRTKAILEATTLRRYEVTGRIDNDAGAFFPVKGQQAQEQKNQNLLLMLEGVDVRYQRLAHIERGCCNNERESKDKMFTCISEAGLLLADHHQLPSKHRVGSYTSSNAEQCAGIMICDVLSQCFLKAFGRMDAEVDEPGNARDDCEDFRKMMRRKVWRAVSSFEPDAKVDRVVTNYLAVPLDKAWMRIQYLDNRGKVLQDMADRRTNPFDEVARQYGSMLFERISLGPLETLFWSVELNIAEGVHERIEDPTREKILSMALQVQFWFNKFHDPPFSLVQIADKSKPYAKRLAVAAAFKRWNLCDLEAGMAEPLSLFYPTAIAMLSDEELIDVLGNWTEVALICSMQVERLIALIKKSVEAKRPPTERLCSSGFITQWSAKHVAAGGQNPKIVDPQAMVNAGAPLNFTHKKKSIPSEGRGHIEYISTKYAERKLHNGGRFSKEAGIQVQKELALEYRTLSLGDRLLWDHQAKNRSGGPDLLDVPFPVDNYDRNRAGVLWGLTTTKQVVIPELAKEMLLTIPGIVRVGGLNSYKDIMRKRLLEDIFIEDDGCVKPGEHVMKATCWNTHPGLCITDDADYFAAALAASKRVHTWSAKNSPCFICVRSIADDGMELETMHFLAFHRHRSPAVSMLAACIRIDFNEDGDGMVDCCGDVTLDELFKPEAVGKPVGAADGAVDRMYVAVVRNDETKTVVLETSYGIVKQHFALHAPEQPANLTIERLNHRNVKDRLDVVQIVEDAVEETNLLRNAAAAKRANKKEPEDENPFEAAFREVIKKEPEKEGKRPTKRGLSKGRAPNVEKLSHSDSEDHQSRSDSDRPASSDERSGDSLDLWKPDDPVSDDDPDPFYSPVHPPPEPVPMPVSEPSPAPPDPEPPIPIPEPPPAPLPKPPLEPDPTHKRIWLTRTGKKAKCSGCNKEIVGHEFRMLFHPDPILNPDPRVWKRSWWLYYHLAPECISTTEVRLDEMPDLIVDCARLPAINKESLEEYYRSIDVAKGELLRIVEALGR